MALSLFTIIYLLLTLLGVSNSQQQLSQGHHSGGLKSLNISVYVHETLNKTAYFIVKGVNGPNNITSTSSPFGSLYVFDDPLTETPNPSSKILGSTEGHLITSSFVGTRSITVGRLSLNLKGYKGDLLNIGTADFTKVQEVPIVGGTGDFRFAQGYLTTTPVDLSTPALRYKFEIKLYWPPYAALAH